MAGWDVRGSRLRRGFTLVELLVVIGIIVLLVGILLPVVNGVRRSAWHAAAGQQIARLTAAIEAYSQEFRAYPGPLSNDQVVTQKGLPAVKSGGAGGGSGTLKNVTMPENLLLGLVGGLEPSPGTTSTGDVGVYNEERVRNRMGPLSLNRASPKGYKAFYEPAAAELSLDPNTTIPAGPFKSEANNLEAEDSQIPEILDPFPDRLPVLYLRARKGARGVISNNGTGVGAYQYDLMQIRGYTAPRSGNSGIGGSGPHGLAELGSVQLMRNVPAPEAPWGPPPNGAPPYNAITYFMHSQLTPTTPTPTNDNATVRNKDTYILIGAGKDRVYGTRDDVTNFGSLD